MTTMIQPSVNVQVKRIRIESHMSPIGMTLALQLPALGNSDTACTICVTAE